MTIHYFCPNCQRTVNIISRKTHNGIVDLPGSELYWWCQICNITEKLKKGDTFYTNEKTFGREKHDLRQDNLSQYVIFGCTNYTEHKFALFRSDVGFQCSSCPIQIEDSISSSVASDSVSLSLQQNQHR